MALASSRPWSSAVNLALMTTLSKRTKGSASKPASPSRRARSTSRPSQGKKLTRMGPSRCKARPVACRTKASMRGAKAAGSTARRAAARPRSGTATTRTTARMRFFRRFTACLPLPGARLREPTLSSEDTLAQG